MPTATAARFPTTLGLSPTTLMGVEVGGSCRPTYWLVRILFIRALSLLTFTTFLMSYRQTKQLIGDDAILPLANVIKRPVNPSRPVLSIFRYLKPPYNRTIDRLSLLGMLLSLIHLATGTASLLTLLPLLAIHVSFQSVGSVFYAFGWESFMYELLCITALMCPLTPKRHITLPVPSATIYLFRWLLFRVLLGSGLIKLHSGDKKWRDLTTMNYFYETQPLPNPLSPVLHRLPKAYHKLETLTNHFIELVVPFFLLAPTRFLPIAGAINVVFQLVLIASGNLSYLNHLTILPALFCFNDEIIGFLFSTATQSQAIIAEYVSQQAATGLFGATGWVRWLVNAAAAGVTAKLSVPVLQNMFSKSQIMNTSFDKFRLVGSYGAFGSVSTTRTELVVLGANDASGPWREYKFKVKAGDVDKPLRFLSPYLYRLDWLMWIATFGGLERNPWVLRLLLMFARNDGSVDKLLERNPFEGEGEVSWRRERESG